MHPEGTAKDPSDPRVAAAVKIVLTCEALRLPQAMRAADFTKQDSKDPKKQMWIRRRVQQIESKQVTSSIDIASPGTTVSSITIPSSASSSDVSSTKRRPKRKQQRMSSSAKQQKLSDDKAERTSIIIMHIKKPQKCMQKS